MERRKARDISHFSLAPKSLSAVPCLSSEKVQDQCQHQTNDTAPPTPAPSSHPLVYRLISIRILRLDHTLRPAESYTIVREKIGAPEARGRIIQIL